MKIVLADLKGELLEAWQKIGHDKDYVSTYHGSIFDVDCDVLVSPANSFGFMDGGIDMAMHIGYQAVGPILCRAVEDKFSKTITLKKDDVKPGRQPILWSTLIVPYLDGVQPVEAFKPILGRGFT